MKKTLLLLFVLFAVSAAGALAGLDSGTGRVLYPPICAEGYCFIDVFLPADFSLYPAQTAKIFNPDDPGLAKEVARVKLVAINRLASSETSSFSGKNFAKVQVTFSACPEDPKCDGTITKTFIMQSGDVKFFAGLRLKAGDIERNKADFHIGLQPGIPCPAYLCPLHDDKNVAVGDDFNLVKTQTAHVFDDSPVLSSSQQGMTWIMDVKLLKTRYDCPGLACFYANWKAKVEVTSSACPEDPACDGLVTKTFWLNAGEKVRVGNVELTALEIRNNKVLFNTNYADEPCIDLTCAPPPKHVSPPAFFDLLKGQEAVVTLPNVNDVNLVAKIRLDDIQDICPPGMLCFRGGLKSVVEVEYLSCPGKVGCDEWRTETFELEPGQRAEFAGLSLGAGRMNLEKSWFKLRLDD